MRRLAGVRRRSDRHFAVDLSSGTEMRGGASTVRGLLVTGGFSGRFGPMPESGSQCGPFLTDERDVRGFATFVRCCQAAPVASLMAVWPGDGCASPD